MGVRGRVWAALYDRMSAPAERAGLADLRDALLRDARGSVLEIGAGTGLNLEHYRPDADIVLTEPAEPMARRLERRVAAIGRGGSVIRAPAEALPFPDAMFDTVVSTLALCSVDDARRALEELHRVLRPGGQLLFLEHVRSDDPRLARRQDRLARPWRVVADGCRCNQPTLSLIQAAGFTLEYVERGDLPRALPLVRPLVHGRAVARSRAEPR